jgi:preprotein translocase subunit SecY
MRLLLIIVLCIYFSYGYSQKVNQTSSGSGNNIAIDKVEGDFVTGNKTINNYYPNRDSLNKKVSIDCIKRTSICFVNKYSFEIKIIGKIGTKLLDLLVLQPGEENCYYQYSRFLAVFMAFVQGISLIALLSSQGVLVLTTLFSKALFVLSVVAGAMLVMWIGELISEFGIGNGVSMIVFAGIVSRLPSDISKGAFTYDASQLPLYIAIFAILFLMIFISVIITEAERPIPVHYSKQVRAGYQTAGTDSYIPLRIAQAGVMPIIFAGSILQLPQILSMFFLKSANPTLLSLGNKFKAFTSANIWYMVIYFVLIFFFTYFYTAVTFDAEAMATNLQKNGAFVPNVRPGAPTADYVATILARTTFFGAVFFSIIAVMPFILQRMTGNALFAIGGTAILIAVSVCTDLIKKLSAQASMKEY